ncbi:MAG: hypothetical protein FJX40_02980 [Alphaproteobacteria bacterium]|nr:hypothetical protein [Alphaproteobacteria bacterium]MBM3641532.1 hypothetical protein [Alphaproteobacteria bacterium]
MANSKFVPEVKEREAGQPCFVALNTDQDIGLGKKQVIFELPNGTDIERAHEFAKMLRSFGVSVRVG